MSGNILRNWFLPKDGISRQVISADIQRYLGNDATVRPGKGDGGNGKEVEGYWIRAYRNLTTEMINDLKVASQKWDQEQRSGTGRRVNYEDSHTYRTSTTVFNGNGTSSPQLEGPYVPPPQPRPGPPQDMGGYPDNRNMYTHPVTSGYADPSLYASQNGGRQPTPGYNQPVDYYGQQPLYNHEPVRTHPGGSPQYAQQYPVNQFGQPQPRDPREDPRYQDYQDPSARYGYGPATTGPNGQAVYSPAQAPSPYSAPFRNEPPYGRPYSQAPPNIPDPTSHNRPPSAADPYARERPTGPGGDVRRRRLG